MAPRCQHHHAAIAIFATLVLPSLRFNAVNFFGRSQVGSPEELCEKMWDTAFIYETNVSQPGFV